jgi:predicted SAM-dependent methyltransferase
MNFVRSITGSWKVQQALKASSHLYRSTLGWTRGLRLPAVLRSRAKIDIHFGCGDFDDPRFINVDARPMPHVHLVTKSPDLKNFARGSVDSIYACHVFEHFPFREQQAVLRRWNDILKPGGTVRLAVPDFDKLVDTFLASDRDPRSVQSPLMGAQDYAGNFHFAIFTRAHLADLLTRCGFEDVAEWHPRDLPDWPKDHSWTDEVTLNLVARKP